MAQQRLLFDYTGTYGGPASRAEILRMLKESLALVEQTAADAELLCGGLRVEILNPGTIRDERRAPRR